MKKVTFVYKGGREVIMKPRLAKAMSKAGQGHIKTKPGGYLTRDMVASRPAPAAPPAAVSITDAARKLAEENGVDIATLTGTGSNGNITVGDVKKAIGN